MILHNKVNTPIGDLDFSVCSDKGDLSSSVLKVCEIEPKLPEGMSVEKCISVLFSCTSQSSIENLTFSCSWSELKQSGGSETGEGLDAWEWEYNNKLVMIGTEDTEFLNLRMELIQSDPDNYPIKMKDNKISITIEQYPKNTELSLHYVVSWNSLPEIEDSSCWFAVDVPHNQIIEACNN